MSNSRIIRVPAHSLEIGNLVYDKYSRTFSIITGLKEVYKRRGNGEILDIAEEIRKEEYKEYVEDECKEGFSYYVTKAFNLAKHVVIGDPKERVMHRIKMHNEMNSNDRYVKSLIVSFADNTYVIVENNYVMQIKQDIDKIPIV